MTRSSTRTAVVTGGSRGIGREIVVRLAADGIAVVVGYAGNMDRAEEAVAEVTGAGGRAVAVQADVADEDAVAAMFDRVHERGRRPSGDLMARSGRRFGLDHEHRAGGLEDDALGGAAEQELADRAAVPGPDDEELGVAVLRGVEHAVGGVGQVDGHGFGAGRHGPDVLTGDGDDQQWPPAKLRLVLGVRERRAAFLGGLVADDDRHDLFPFLRHEVNRPTGSSIGTTAGNSTTSTAAATV